MKYNIISLLNVGIFAACRVQILCIVFFFVCIRSSIDDDDDDAKDVLIYRKMVKKLLLPFGRQLFAFAVAQRTEAFMPNTQQPKNP